MAANQHSASNPKEIVNTSVRAQLLATEHWSLLATRSMTWSEVMSRITIHLSVTSASLVVVALVAQVSGFGTAFHVLSIGLASAVLILGTLTGVRVNNASIDDSHILQGMNRLRAGYVDLEPEIKKYLVTSYKDDRAGIMRSYLMGARRSMPSHIFGSTNMYMHMVNTLTAGTLGALITSAAGGGPLAVAVFGVLAGLLCLLCWLDVGRRSFGSEKLSVNFPSTPESP